jgi:hypothetical protein
VARFQSIKNAISYCGLCGAEKRSADKVVRMGRRLVIEVRVITVPIGKTVVSLIKAKLDLAEPPVGFFQGSVIGLLPLLVGSSKSGSSTQRLAPSLYGRLHR